ncbi:MAG: AAA family ATPase [Polyangiaceae bacterium]|nr:AAA family ATPase [Polyangiaceae bacterium]
MRIDGVYLKGVGPFGEVRLDFQPKKASDKADLHIFVGQNGSGKSTLLYAMAAALAGPEEGFGPNHALRRMYGKDSLFALSAEGSVFAITNMDRALAKHIKEPFSGQATQPGVPSSKGDYVLRQSANPNRIAQYRSAAAKHIHVSGWPALNFAAFAYSGSRSLVDQSVSAIEEPTDGPLAQSLSFDNTVDPKRLAQWLSATFAKRALAKERSHSQDAERFGTSIERIEEVVSEVTGAPIKLAFDYAPHFRILAERHGRTIDLDLLADGLKSILSWIADLLMRLDRIPWEPNVAVIERSFALFLDEIDIHLHPAWQRKVLLVVQKLFPQAQIFVTTHSPFVVSSVSDAWVYRLVVDEKGDAHALPPVESQAGTSFQAVVKSIFGVEEEFDEDTEAGFRRFYEFRERILSGDMTRFDEFKALGAQLAARGVEVSDIVGAEMARVARRMGQRS